MIPTGACADLRELLADAWAGRRDAELVGVATAHAVERAIEQARLHLQTYMALPMSLMEVVNEHFPSEVPEWSAGFCFAPGRHIPHDGRVVVICLLDKGHQGDCGGTAQRLAAKRSPGFLQSSALRMAQVERARDRMVELGSTPTAAFAAAQSLVPDGPEPLRIPGP